jgi:hypothetical protein
MNLFEYTLKTMRLEISKKSGEWPESALILLDEIELFLKNENNKFIKLYFYFKHSSEIEKVCYKEKNKDMFNYRFSHFFNNTNTFLTLFLVLKGSMDSVNFNYNHLINKNVKITLIEKAFILSNYNYKIFDYILNNDLDLKIMKVKEIKLMSINLNIN